MESDAQRCACGRWTQEVACVACQGEAEPASEAAPTDEADNAPLDAVLRRKAKRYGRV